MSSVQPQFDTYDLGQAGISGSHIPCPVSVPMDRGLPPAQPPCGELPSPCFI